MEKRLSSAIGGHGALVCLCEISCGGFSMSRTQPKDPEKPRSSLGSFSVSFLKENRINIASRQGLNETLIAQTPAPSHSLPHMHLLIIQTQHHIHNTSFHNKAYTHTQ